MCFSHEPIALKRAASFTTMKSHHRSSPGKKYRRGSGASDVHVPTAATSATAAASAAALALAGSGAAAAASYIANL